MSIIPTLILLYLIMVFFLPDQLIKNSISCAPSPPHKIDQKTPLAERVNRRLSDPQSTPRCSGPRPGIFRPKAKIFTPLFEQSNHWTVNLIGRFDAREFLEFPESPLLKNDKMCELCFGMVVPLIAGVSTHFSRRTEFLNFLNFYFHHPISGFISYYRQIMY